jgi:hypothetical protein
MSSDVASISEFDRRHPRGGRRWRHRRADRAAQGEDEVDRHHVALHEVAVEVNRALALIDEPHGALDKQAAFLRRRLWDRPREWASRGVCRGVYQGHEALGTTPQNGNSVTFTRSQYS